MRQPPVDYIEQTRAQYDALGFPTYTWVESEDAPPWTALAKSLKECRVGLIASGGIYRAGQVAFHHKDDVSFRIIEANTPRDELRITHFAYDQRDARRDPNAVFPLDTLQALVEEGAIAGVSPNAYTFMGGIYSARRVRDQLAPALAERVIEDEVDVVLLVPV